MLLWSVCPAVYICEGFLSENSLMTSIRDHGVEISPLCYWTNVIIQLVNVCLISTIIFGHYLFLYLVFLVLIYRMQSVTRVLQDPQLARATTKLKPRERRSLLIACHLIYLEVSR